MPEAVAADADGLPLVIGRYALFDALASGGMATVHLGRLLGPSGVGRTVAVKRLHEHFTTDQEFVAMFMDEARIVERIRHPNVVPMVDVLESPRGVFLIMEYIHGESFSKLLRICRAASDPVPFPIITSIVHGALLGLHAAHETTDDNGVFLEVVHRDVSPQNIIVGSDGIARVLDFGVAKAAGRAQITRAGQIKGKLAYMAPEQIRGAVDRRSDVFAASVVLWEALAGGRLHEGASDVDIVTRVVKGSFGPPSTIRPDIPPELDAIVMRGLAINPTNRYATAAEMASDLETTIGLAPPEDVASWVARLAGDVLSERTAKVAAMEIAAVTLTPGEPAQSLARATPTSGERLPAAAPVAPPPSQPQPHDREERTERMEMPALPTLPDLRPSSFPTMSTTGPHLSPSLDRPRLPQRRAVLMVLVAGVFAIVVIIGVIAIVKSTVRRGVVRSTSHVVAPAVASSEVRRAPPPP